MTTKLAKKQTTQPFDGNLRRLQSRAIWRGAVVHHVINTVFNNYLANMPIPFEKADEILVRIMKNEWAESYDWLNVDDPGAFCGLMEHYYGELRDPQEGLEEEIEFARRHLRGLYQSKMLDEIVDQKVQVIEKEKLRSFAIHNVPIVLKIDLAIKDTQGKGFLVDWKTSQASKGNSPDLGDGHQLLLYALYVHRQYGIPYQNIYAQNIHLAQQETVPVKIDQPGIEETQAYVLETAEQMMRLHDELISADKKAVQYPQALCRSQNENQCGKCRFRGLCLPHQYPYPTVWRREMELRYNGQQPHPN